MKLEQLVQVMEIAKTQSISKAAANLFLSQPGLSASVKQLESELGADLFIRHKKGVELTAVGSRFLNQAKTILEDIRALENISKDDPYVSRTLTVAAGHFRFAGVAIGMLLNKHKNDGARFIMRNGINKDCIDWVAEGICDVGLVYVADEEEADFIRQMRRKQLLYQRIYQTDTRIIIGKGHPLYDTDVTEIDAVELMKYPQVSHDQTTVKDYFRSAFLNTDRDNLRVIITDQSTMYQVLEFSDGYCLGFCNDIVYQNIPRQAGTRELKVTGSQVNLMNVGWIAPAGTEQLTLVAEFLDLLTELCTELRPCATDKTAFN